MAARVAARGEGARAVVAMEVAARVAARREAATAAVGMVAAAREAVERVEARAAEARVEGATVVAGMAAAGGDDGGGDGSGQSCGEGGCRVLREGKGEPSAQIVSWSRRGTRRRSCRWFMISRLGHSRALPLQSSAMQLQSRFHCAETWRAQVS